MKPVSMIPDDDDTAHVPTSLGVGEVSDNATTPRFRHTPQQTDILDWVSDSTGNAFVEAVAGAGKTTVLIAAMKRALDMGARSIAYAAFNRAISVEVNKKWTDLYGDQYKRNIRIGTFHSFGFGAWRRVYQNVVMDDRAKMRQMFDACDVPRKMQSAVRKLVSLAKQSAVCALWQPDDVDQWMGIIEHFGLLYELDQDGDLDDYEMMTNLMVKGIECVEWSRRMGPKLIDYDDMIWLPVISRVNVWQNNWTLVDEAQDTNPVRRLLAKKMTRSDGRMLWVGDRHQAIYGFTGADAKSVDNIKKEFRCVELPLTVTHRCPKSVVDVARQWVRHITAADSAPAGVVTYVTREQFLNREHPSGYGQLRASDAILCRNTKPLVKLAFRLIRSGIGCHVEGRDIGEGLRKLATRWQVNGTDELSRHLEDMRERETTKAIEKAGGDEEQAKYEIEAINDRIDTLYAIMEGCDTVQQVVDRIDRMFADSEGGQESSLTLATVHRSKGREWGRVYILGHSAYMPSKYARRDWQVEQETNLRYVAVTRSQKELFLMDALED